MLRKTVTLVLFGILTMGAATVAYGTLYGDGFAASVGGVLGAGEDEHEDDEHKQRGGHDDD